MITKRHTFIAGFAWAAVAILEAAPASAIAWTSQSGDYAACSANTFFSERDICSGTYWAGYIQTIRFVETSCNQGDCNAPYDEVYTDWQYSTGRKTAVLETSCSDSEFWNVYALDYCAC